MREAQNKAVKVGEWLLPSEGGALEAEGQCQRQAWEGGGASAG